MVCSRCQARSASYYARLIITAVDLKTEFRASQRGKAWGAMFAPYAGEEENKGVRKKMQRDDDRDEDWLHTWRDGL